MNTRLLLIFFFLGIMSSQDVPSAAQTRSGSLPDPCSLVTQADVQLAMGEAATMSHTHNARTGKDECRMKGTMPGLQEIVLVVNRADSFWNTTKKSLISVDKTVRQVSGLGDDAYTGRMVGYNVRKGNRAIQVFGDLTNNDTANEKATRLLAERAVARL